MKINLSKIKTMAIDGKKQKETGMRIADQLLKKL